MVMSNLAMIYVHLVIGRLFFILSVRMGIELCICFCNFSLDHELLELAASFQSPSGQPATNILSVSRRVRSALRQAEKPTFVSAFCQANCGDVSPNVLGAFCIDTGLPCDFNHSTCGGKNELCYGRGPG